MTTDELLQAYKEIQARRTGTDANLIIKKDQDSIQVLTQLQEAGVSKVDGMPVREMIEDYQENIRAIRRADRP